MRGCKEVIGLYEAGSVGGLFGFRIGIIVASFQVLGIVLCCAVVSS